MPGPGEDETCREEQAARENPGSTDTPGITGKRGCQLKHILRTKRNLCDEHTAERSRQRRKRSNPFQVHRRAWSQVEWLEGSPDPRLSTKTPFMSSTELPDAAMTPLGRACWNTEGSQ